MGKVLHASYSGYFPNCINNPDAIAALQEAIDFGFTIDELRNLQAGLEQQMFFYWVVRTITVSWAGETLGESGMEPFSANFLITTLQTQEEQLVCGKLMSAESGEVSGFSYSQPDIRGVLGLGGDTYGGVFRFVFSDPQARYGVKCLGEDALPGEEKINYSMVLNNEYSINIPIIRTSDQTTYNSFSIAPTDWFNYGGIYTNGNRN